MDFEDTFTYSVTRAIQVPSLKGKSNWIIYPNPSELRSNVTVGLINPSNYHDEPIIVRISDVRGINVSYSANSVEEVNQAVNSYLETAISGMHIVQLIWGDQNEQLKLIRK
ncbi:T9SS type A sorting domain-containing protein [Algoriphagus halophilus]|uniref:T9SS type A sorting domain-containing protein n=1 Tax=Algoriphagus halophilus TaxID=226505 RepID=UPI00358F19BC